MYKRRCKKCNGYIDPINFCGECMVGERCDLHARRVVTGAAKYCSECYRVVHSANKKKPGLYFCTTEDNGSIHLSWYEGRWYYPSSDMKYRGKVTDWRTTNGAVQ